VYVPEYLIIATNKQLNHVALSMSID